MTTSPRATLSEGRTASFHKPVQQQPQLPVVLRLCRRGSGDETQP